MGASYLLLRQKYIPANIIPLTNLFFFIMPLKRKHFLICPSGSFRSTPCCRPILLSSLYPPFVLSGYIRLSVSAGVVSHVDTVAFIGPSRPCSSRSRSISLSCDNKTRAVYQRGYTGLVMSGHRYHCPRSPGDGAVTRTRCGMGRCVPVFRIRP